MRLPAAPLLALALAASPAAPAANYSDIWWNPREPGWGLTVADHETNLWAIWYTYRRDGSPTWMFASGGTLDAGRTRFSGPLFEASGPSYRAPYASRPVTVAQVGSITIDFAPSGLAPGSAVFQYTVGDVSGTRQIERYGFGDSAPAWGNDATDLWWDPRESGWGIALAQHGGGLFGVWYTYDDTGRPLFVVLPAGTRGAAGQFSGELFTTRGPWFGEASFDASKVTTASLATSRVTLQPGAAVQGFTPQRGGWTVRFPDGTATVRFFTQLGFGNAAPGIAAPPCAGTGTCIAPETPATPTNCSYRSCTAAYQSDDYYYPMSVPCSCRGDASLLNVACVPDRPPVADGAACSDGKGCAAGSVCADLYNGLPPICMPQATFNSNHCRP